MTKDKHDACEYAGNSKPEKTQAEAAQRVWAKLGGLGPVPRLLPEGDRTDEFLAIGMSTTVEKAREAAAFARHDLRLRLITSALTGQAGRLADPAVSAGQAIDLADAVLARLEAEARGES